MHSEYQGPHSWRDLKTAEVIGNRQYLTIGVVGVILFVIIWLALGVYSADGFLRMRRQRAATA